MQVKMFGRDCVCERGYGGQKIWNCTWVAGYEFLNHFLCENLNSFSVSLSLSLQSGIIWKKKFVLLWQGKTPFPFPITTLLLARVGLTVWDLMLVSDSDFPILKVLRKAHWGQSSCEYHDFRTPWLDWTRDLISWPLGPGLSGKLASPVVTFLQPASQHYEQKWCLPLSQMYAIRTLFDFCGIKVTPLEAWWSGGNHACPLGLPWMVGTLRNTQLGPVGRFCGSIV